ncbi:hypothetical protein ACKFKG_23225 [Phormidesmis sp. 146-35]
MNLKSLTFYVGSIGIVVALFSFTTAYGEANLKASTKIEGRYRIPAQNLPGCLKDDDPVVLMIQQSGVYLSASLLSKNETSQTITAARKKPSLSGTWEEQKLELSGLLSYLDDCQKDGERSPTVKIEGTFSQNNLRGKIRLDSSLTGINFTGKRDSDQ